MKLIGDNLKKLRKHFKLTQKELAIRVNLSREMICKIERNKVNPSVEILYSICSKLEVNVDRLISQPIEPQ